jgi:hypothetical protein
LVSDEVSMFSFARGLRRHAFIFVHHPSLRHTLANTRLPLSLLLPHFFGPLGAASEKGCEDY